MDMDKNITIGKSTKNQTKKKSYFHHVLAIVYHKNTYPNNKFRDATQEATDTYEYSALFAFYTAGNQIQV